MIDDDDSLEPCGHSAAEHLAGVAAVAHDPTWKQRTVRALLENLLPCGHFRAEECHCEDRFSSGES